MPGLLSLGVALIGIRRHDQALEILDRARAVAPQDAKVLEARGNVLMLLGRRDEAITSYEASLAIQPTAEGLNNYGHALRRMSRYEDAGKAYERVLTIRPDFSMAKGYLWTSRLYCCD